MFVYTEKSIFENDEYIILKKKKYTGENSVHFHEFVELVYVFSGNITHIISSEKYEVERGNMIFIPVGSTHDITDSKSVSFVEILVKKDVFDIILDEFKKENSVADEEFEENYMPCTISFFAGGQRHKIETIIQEMLTEYNDDEIGAQSVLLSYLKILITLIVRNRINTPQKVKGIPIDVINYIDVHYRKNLKSEELAAKSFYSTKYFSHIFKKSMGVSLTEYIAKKRIDEGCRLLIETDMTIDEISKSLGWENNTQFYNNFKKYCSVTPHAYRKKQR